MDNRNGKTGTVTWQDAEDALLAAVEYLGQLPDRDRAALSAGSRSAWPQIIRSVRDGDYGEGQGLGGAAASPSAALSRRQLRLVEAMILNPDCAAMAIEPVHRALVGRVLVMKLWPGAEGFGWDRIWRGEAVRWKREGAKPVTSDALRMRYERAVNRVAVNMERLGMGPLADAA